MDRRTMTVSEIRASLPPGERISEIRRDGTLVLIRPDYTVGTVANALYITEPSARHAYGTRAARLAPARVDDSAPDAVGPAYSQGAYRPMSVGGWFLDENGDDL